MIQTFCWNALFWYVATPAIAFRDSSVTIVRPNKTSAGADWAGFEDWKSWPGACGLGTPAAPASVPPPLKMKGKKGERRKKKEKKRGVAERANPVEEVNLQAYTD